MLDHEERGLRDCQCRSRQLLGRKEVGQGGGMMAEEETSLSKKAMPQSHLPHPMVSGNLGCGFAIDIEDHRIRSREHRFISLKGSVQVGRVEAIGIEHSTCSTLEINSHIDLQRGQSE
jgi:hypothetical protein